MAHLVCQDHRRRVHTTNKSIVHREDRTVCDGGIVKIGDRYYTHTEIADLRPGVRLKTGDLKNVDDGLNPEERLLKAMFGQKS